MSDSQDYKKIKDLFEKYFKTISKIQGRYSQPIPYLTNKEYYTCLDNFKKYQTFYENIVKQPVFDTTEANKFFEVQLQSLAAFKSILDKFKNISDPFKISTQELDNLLLSFGFNLLNFPEFSKRQLLLNLVHNYKIKGTKDSIENILSILFPSNIKISEISFEKINSQPKLTYSLDIEVPGLLNPHHKFIMDASVAEKDRHWWLKESDLQNWDVNKAMTPFFNVSNFINMTANNAAIILLRTYAQQDYNVYLNGSPEEYENTKQITLNSLPLRINWLELYLLIRYIYGKKYNLESFYNDDPNHLNYSHIPPDTDTDIIIDEINAQWKTRYDKQFGDIESETKNCIYESILKTIPLCKHPKHAEANSYYINNLIGTSSIVFKNKIILAGGRFENNNQYNTRLYIFNTYSLNNVYYIDTGIELMYPIITAGARCSKVCITGGYNPDGTKNYRTWMIDLNTNNVIEIQNIQKKLWMKRPLTVNTNLFTFVISKDEDDECPGAIYIWNVCSNYKKLLAYLNPEHYDISTINAVANSDNTLLITVKSKLSGGTRFIYLNPNPKYEIFVDITCQLLKNMPVSLRNDIVQQIYRGSIFVNSYGKNFYLYLKKDGKLYIHGINLKIDEYNYKTKIKPKYISGMLIPSRICQPCNVYENSQRVLGQFCDFDFSQHGLTVDSIVEYYDWYFLNVYDADQNQKWYMWPLLQQIYTMCCNSPINRISNILPNIELEYDGGCFYDINEEFDEECIFNFICWNPIHRTLGPLTNIDIWTFHYAYKLSHAENRNDHFCYSLYDSCCDYDVDPPINIVCFSNYPDMTDMVRNHPHYDKIKYLYYEEEIPEYLTLSFLYDLIVLDPQNCLLTDIVSFNISTTAQSYVIVFESPQDFIDGGRASSVYFSEIDSGSSISNPPNEIDGGTSNSSFGDGTNILIFQLYPKLQKIIAQSCDFVYTQNTDYARDFRTEMLQERNDKFVNNNEVLPVFNNFDELSQFLTDNTYENKLEIDTTNNIDVIFYELLSVASSIYPDADLTLLNSDYVGKQIYNVIDVFKPIYSRPLETSIFNIIADPIGDWVTLETSFEMFALKTLDDVILNISDCSYLNVIKKYDIHLPINERLVKEVQKSFYEYPTIFDCQDKPIINPHVLNHEYISMHDEISFNNIEFIYDTTIKYDSY